MPVRVKNVFLGKLGWVYKLKSPFCPPSLTLGQWANLSASEFLSWAYPCFKKTPQEGDKEALPLGYNPNTVEGIELMQNHKNKDDVAMVQEKFKIIAYG